MGVWCVTLFSRASTHTHITRTRSFFPTTAVTPLPSRASLIPPSFLSYSSPPLTPHVYRMCGVFAGLSTAAPTFTPTRPGLLPPASVGHGALRLVVGLVILVGAWFAVRAVEKGLATTTLFRLALRFVRYAQVPPIILFAVPAVFEMTGIQ